MKFQKQLPRLEKPHAKYFITFVTWERLELTPAARQVVLECCKYFDNQKYKLYAVVIMPDHVHLLIEPLLKDETEFWSIGSILHSIKSYSAKQIPNVMLHIGKVWQDGRYDEMIKNEQEFINKWEYILQNPVKAGLSNTPDEYPFLWDRF
ncbi:transposase [Anabaena sp. FACHB-1391]|jgi:REP element-mobilizing transposase RayT|uniref:REP-associated tyrosine transposase n=1 Tax=Anabaena sp. FACHB-1391 TaxID=2692771 RepID=UPI0016801949|nr:transposase [Anabaena sp. FACHB-1391]MBD2267450.1 transposase [Anabaena sp. FACHB-1391]